MATHSSILAWEIPWAEEPGGLQSMGSQRARHDRATFTSLHLWTVAHQVPLPMGFPKQEYWSGLPFPSPGNLPNRGIEPESPDWRVYSLPLSHQGSLKIDT